MITGRGQAARPPAIQVAALLRPSTQDQKVEPTALRLGETVERELKSKETQTFRLELKAGEYIKVVATTSGSNLVVQAIAPGDKVAGQIGFSGEWRTQSFWVLADVTGVYQIKVRSIDTIKEGGRYSLNLQTVGEYKTAPAADQDYVEAFQLFWEGESLDDQSKPDFPQAIQKYEATLDLWRRLGDRRSEALTLHAIAFSQEKLQNKEQAIANYEKALMIWRELGDQYDPQASTLYNLGSIYSYTGKTTEAITSYKEAAALRRRINDSAGLAFVLTNLGATYLNTGDFKAALECQQEAASLRRSLGDLSWFARSLSNLAAVYFRLGELQTALNYSLESLPLRRAAGDRVGEAITLANIGSTYRELGQPQQALTYYQQSRPLFRAAEVGGSDTRVAESSVLDAMGQAYYELGDYPKALELFNEALVLKQQLADRYGEGTLLSHIGYVNGRMGDREKAREYLRQALEIQRSISDRRSQALTLRRTGEVYQQSGDIAGARKYFDEALDLVRAIKNRALEANLLYDIALNERAAGLLTDARTHVEDAIRIVESARAAVASSELRASFLASKQDFYELDIDVLMQSYPGGRDQQTMERAFTVSEQRRARSLLDGLEAERANVRRQAPADLLDRERALRAKLDYKAESQIKLLSGKHTEEQARILANEIEIISRDYEQVVAQIAAADPHYAALTSSTALSVGQLQKEILDPDALLLEYSMGKERSYLWAVTPTELKTYQLPGRAEIETKSRAVYDLLTARDRFVKFEKPAERQARIAKADAEYFEAASRLSQMLLSPVANLMKGRRLIIVADGALQYLPFAALPAPQAPGPLSETSARDTYRPLMVDHEITNLPSASILSVLRREVAGRKPPPKVVAVLADAVFSKNDSRVIRTASMSRSTNDRAHSNKPVSDVNGGETPSTIRPDEKPDGNELALDRLPFTRQEAQTILAMIPPSQRFAAFDFAANRAAATSPELGQYRIVHFATHGLLNGANPGLSGLIFSLVDRQGKDQNGLLPTQQIFDLQLPADLIVLSGCQTGLGKEIKGEGIQGLTRGFMYAGAARVAVSLWDVNDRSTAELMGHFYEGMLGPHKLRPAAALREAQTAMWKSPGWHAPYYWAAFVLQGEYR